MMLGGVAHTCMEHCIQHAACLINCLCVCSCGSMSHQVKDCLERPRAKGAKWTGKNIAADDKIEDLKITDFDAKRDRWNGYDAKDYAQVRAGGCSVQHTSGSCTPVLCESMYSMQPHTYGSGTPQLAVECHACALEVCIHPSKGLKHSGSGFLGAVHMLTPRLTVASRRSLTGTSSWKRSAQR